MGKTRAEIQRAYRQRKKEKEGESYLDKERKRIKKYYVPVEERSKKDQRARREKVRKYVREHRMRKTVEKNQNASNNNQRESEPGMIVESDENGVSSSTPAMKLIVKMPSFDTKQRTRKRVSRAVSKNHREIKKLKDDKQDLNRKYKRVSKRYERLMKSQSSTSITPTEMLAQNMDIPDAAITKQKPLTPRKRVANDLREVGVSPSKIPRRIHKKLLLGSVITDEINEARKSNGRKGRKIIANILSGKLLKKYKLKRLLNKSTGLSRKVKESTSKKCDEVPKQEKQPSLKKEKRAKVIEFLQRDDNSRMMPGKNDKVKVNKQHQQKRVLNDNMGFLHMKYKAETDDKMSFSTFCRMRPKSICLTRYITKNQWLCQKHENMALTLKGVRSCGASVHLNPDEFNRKVEENESLVDDLCESLPDVIRHEQWKKVTLDDGKKRTKVVGVDLEKDIFIKTIQDQIQDFRQHIIRVKQQYKAIGDLKQSLPEGHVISHMDFAENFACGTSDEVQSAYWNSNAITLHPVVMYYRENGELKHKNYVFVSDDLGHNIGSVFAIMKKLIPDIRQTLNCELKKVYYWTDGPSSQYRNKTAFYIVSNHQELFGANADWNYFESGHGKGACDGVGGTAKRMADLSIKQSKISIQEANDFFEWGKEYHKNAKYILVTPENCTDARNEVEEINKNICPVKGTLQLHHVAAISKGKVIIRITSCYCEQCLGGRFHTEYDERSLIKESKSNKEKETKNNEPIMEKDNKKTGKNKSHNKNGKELNESHAQIEAAGHDIEINNEARMQTEERGKETQMEINTNSWKIDDWVAVNYDNGWHIGQIREVDQEENDCLVSFMRRDACQIANMPSFKWPNPADEIWVSFGSLLLPIKEPSKIGRSGRKFSILSDEIQAIDAKMELVD